MSKYLFIIGLVFSIWFFSQPVQAKEVLTGPVPAQVLRVIDGDTLVVNVKIWLGQNLETRVRLDGLDTPELRGKCNYEKDLAQQAKEKVISLVDGQSINLFNVQLGKFAGRVVADVGLENGNDLKTQIIDAGLGRAYSGGKRQPWCS